MNINPLKNLTIATIVSIVFHIGLLNILFFLQINFPDAPDSSNKKTFVINKIDRQKVKKLKTVGVKNGSKEFNQEITLPDTPMAKQPLKKKNLSLKSLALKQPSTRAVKKVLNNRQRSKSENQTGKISVTKAAPSSTVNKMEKAVDKQIIKDSVLSKIAVSPDAVKVLNKTDFNIHFVPPEGVSEDELNSAEKIYYSFQKRTFKSYVSSF